MNEQPKDTDKLPEEKPTGYIVVGIYTIVINTLIILLCLLSIYLIKLDPEKTISILQVYGGMQTEAHLYFSIVLTLVVYVLPSIIGGYFLIKGKNWARYMIITINLIWSAHTLLSSGLENILKASTAVNLLVSGCIIYYLTRPWVVEFFEPGSGAWETPDDKKQPGPPTP